jgi:flagellar hook-basal body complex protein FliE
MSIQSHCTWLGSFLLLGTLAASAQGQFSPYGGAPPAIGFGGGALGGAGIYGGAANPYTALGAGAIAASNPYGSYSGNALGYNPFMSYGQYGNGGIFGAQGGALYGAAQVISAYGQAVNAQEQARLLREQYYQAQIETQRKRFDLAMYIKSRTPTFTEEQANTSRAILRRIQDQPAASEVANGKALNLLMDDATKFGRRPALDPIPIAPEVLKGLNVTKQGTGLGVLRNEGKINWPIALADVLTPEQRKNISLQAQAVVRDAAKGKNPDANVFKDLRTEINTTREQLLKRVNDVPGEQYMQAKRFLSELENSLQAVQQGEVEVQTNFDNFIAGKAQNVEDVIDFMKRNGYRFAPGTQGDEASYRAIYSALRNYDVALNQQFNSEPPKDKE